MNFVTEAKRLGILPPSGSRYSDEWDPTGPDRIIALPGFETDGIREDDLCVDGCADCREFRAEVKRRMDAEWTDAWQAFFARPQTITLGVPGTFEFIAPVTEQESTMKTLRGEFGMVEEAVRDLVPAGRYQSLALTALEEAAMWANKGVSRA